MAAGAAGIDDFISCHRLDIVSWHVDNHSALHIDDWMDDGYFAGNVAVPDDVLGITNDRRAFLHHLNSTSVNCGCLIIHARIGLMVTGKRLCPWKLDYFVIDINKRFSTI